MGIVGTEGQDLAENTPRVARLRELTNGDADVTVNLDDGHINAEHAKVNTALGKVNPGLQLTLDHREAQERGNVGVLMQHTRPKETARGGGTVEGYRQKTAKLHRAQHQTENPLFPEKHVHEACAA